jgi:hypothetical protein
MKAASTAGATSGAMDGAIAVEPWFFHYSE